MDFDDSPSSAAACSKWWKNFGLKIKRIFRKPSSAPPWIILAEDLHHDHKWTSFLRRFQYVVSVLCIGFVLATIFLLVRSWSQPCAVPLNVFSVVAACLVLLFNAALIGFFQWKSSLTVRIVVLVLSLLMFAWAIVGVVFLAESSDCVQPAPVLFGLAITFVCLSLIPSVLLVVLCVVQVIGVKLLEKEVVSGAAVSLLAGGRMASSAILGVSVIGDSGTGKTSLLKALDRLSGQVFPKGWKCRVTDENPKNMALKANRITFGEEDARREPLRTTDLVNADVVVICFSLNDRRSFHSVKMLWLKHASEHAMVPVVLVGCKMAPPAHALHFRGGTSEVPSSLLQPQEQELWLPSSVLLRIMAYLPNRDLVNAMLVCRLWKSLARHHFVWKNRSTGPVLKAEVLRWIKQVYEDKTLKYSGFPKIEYFEIDSVSQTKPEERKVVKFWKRAVELCFLNESKMRVGRKANGFLRFSNR